LVLKTHFFLFSQKKKPFIIHFSIQKKKIHLKKKKVMISFNYLSFKPIYVLISGIFIIEVNSFTPIGRYAHSSVLLGNKLCFFGGYLLSSLTHSNEVFYLDVSQPFNSENPPWVDLTSSAAIPFKGSWFTVSLINNNDPTIYLFGGTMNDPVSNNDSFVSFVHTFNPQTLKWDIPTTKGEIPTRRRNIQAVSDNSGKVYIFGGYNDTTNTVFNNMIIFDTNILTWSYGTIIAPPTARDSYTATLLSNGVIVYIGGLDVAEKVININEINLYDTKSDAWIAMVHDKRFLFKYIKLRIAN